MSAERTLRLIQRIASERVRQKSVPRRGLARPTPTAAQTTGTSDVGTGSPPVVVDQTFFPAFLPSTPIGGVTYSIKSSRWKIDFPRPEEQVAETVIGGPRVIRESTLELKPPALIYNRFADNP